MRERAQRRHSGLAVGVRGRRRLRVRTEPAAGDQKALEGKQSAKKESGPSSRREAEVRTKPAAGDQKALEGKQSVKKN